MSVLGPRTTSIPRPFGPNVGPNPSQLLGRRCHPLLQLWTLGPTSSGQLTYPQQPPVRPQTEGPQRPPHLAQISVCPCAPVTKRICFKCTTRQLKLPKNATPAANPHSSNLNCSLWFSTASSLPWKRDLDKSDLIEVVITHYRGPKNDMKFKVPDVHLFGITSKPDSICKPSFDPVQHASSE